MFGLLLPASALIPLMTVTAAPIEWKDDCLLLSSGSQSLTISTRCPRLEFEKTTFGGQAPPSPVRRDLADGGQAQIVFPPHLAGPGIRIEVRLVLQWSAADHVLRKWVRVRSTGTASPGVLRQVILDLLESQPRAASSPASGPSPWDTIPMDLPRDDPDPQSRPVFMPGAFVGIEFPTAATRTIAGHIVLACAPGVTLQPGVWYETHKAVYAVTPPGEERKAFLRYLTAHRPPPCGLHVNYNSWWTTPIPYSEPGILGLMRSFQDHLYRPHGVSFDTFCIDAGWTDAHSVWKIDPKLFPQGFEAIKQSASDMKSHLGLWISPSNCYSGMGGVTDNKWAATQGYETFKGPHWSDTDYRFPCLAGPRYRKAIRDCLVDMVSRSGVRHIKFDGYLFTCPEEGHGHVPGRLSADAVAGGMIEVFEAIRNAAPDTWLEATCFGWNPSPWWLFHVNSVIGTYGDDAPAGRVPCPVYRESYTTARDYFNLQGAAHLVIPPAAHEVLGIVHQTREPFLNDAVITVLRGGMFLPVYLNPQYMDDGRWRGLAELLRWARRHEAALTETVPLLPQTWLRDGVPRFTRDAKMPREPYGYAHFGPTALAASPAGGLVALRNPWIEPAEYAVPLPESLPADVPLQAVSLYPEVRRYGSALRPGDTLRVPLAPYETLVLALEEESSTAAPGRVDDPLGRRITVPHAGHSMSRVRFDSPGTQPFGPDWTNLDAGAPGKMQIELRAEVELRAPQGEFLILVESAAKAPEASLSMLTIDGQEVSPETSDSETGWRADGGPLPERWRFFRARLTEGTHTLRAELMTAEGITVSGWVWATKPGSTEKFRQDALPQPELISLDAVAVCPPLRSEDAPPTVTCRPARLERIDGAFLDSLEPMTATQGWGSLERNISVWKKPLTLSGKRYQRGLGTHAPARLIYALDGRYRRFQAWAGVDGAATGTVTLEVVVDGKTSWESGKVGPSSPAGRVDLDVTGARRLELIAGDAGDFASDHVDWADARLLR